jgi:hypothetical protein
MATSAQPTDPRIAYTIKHLKALAKRHSRRLVVNDYLEYRAKHARDLPSMTTLYRLFGSWNAALEQAGVNQIGKTELSRTSDEALIAALQEAAEALGVKVLSSHAYDQYRASSAPHLPSSSVIRKWLGHWAEAVKRAGLETTDRAVPRRPGLSEIIDALRTAKQHVDGMLSPQAYSEFLQSVEDETERDRYPTAQEILRQFTNWEAALRAADVEQSDTLHPTALWSAEEARRLASLVERITGRPLNKRDYERVAGEARRPMPSWKVMRELLSDTPPQQVETTQA